MEEAGVCPTARFRTVAVDQIIAGDLWDVLEVEVPEDASRTSAGILSRISFFTVQSGD